MLEALLFVFSMAVSHGESHACLALNIWHEARGESIAGQAMVAQNVMARVASPHYANTVCGVVFEKMPGGARAYSWVPADGSVVLPKLENPIEIRALLQAFLVADAFLTDDDPVRFAGLESGVLYHRATICPPFCRSPYAKRLAQVGAHVVYQESRTRPFVRP